MPTPQNTGDVDRTGVITRSQSTSETNTAATASTPSSATETVPGTSQTSNTTPIIMPGGINIDKFNGKQIAVQWWTMFIQWCGLHHYHDIPATLPFMLAEGAPTLWYYNLSEEVKNNIERLKAAFLQRFAKQSAIFDVGILQMKQREDENVDDFFVRMETQIRDTVIPDNILVGMIIKALRGNIAEKVFSRIPQPTTMAEVREAALHAEQAVSLNGDTSIASLHYSIRQLADRFDASLAALGPNNARQEDRQYRREGEGGRHQQRQENTVCNRCGTLCKRSSKCPAYDKICYKCNKKGHFGRVCISNRRSHFDNNSSSRNSYRRH